MGKPNRKHPETTDLRTFLPTYNHELKQESFSYTFTVFTPIYNRGKTIHRVFESLKKQTFKDFELLIINDGSNDNSDEVIKQLIKDADFEVRYINNEVNQHKLACLFQGFSLAKGELFLTLDSDDECEENALEVFYNRYQNIPESKKDHISSMTCMCKDQFGNPVGDIFETDPYYSSTFKNMLDDKYQKEKWGLVKTNVIKRISINPQLFGQGYIPEGVIWCFLSKLGFETYYFNDFLRTYYIDEDDQNISSDSRKNHPLGLGIYGLGILNWFYKDFSKNPKLFLKWIYYLLLASKYLPYKRQVYSQSIEYPLFRFIFNLVWPVKHIVITRK